MNNVDLSLNLKPFRSFTWWVIASCNGFSSEAQLPGLHEENVHKKRQHPSIMGNHSFLSRSLSTQQSQAIIYRGTLKRPSTRSMRILSPSLLAIAGLAAVTCASPPYFKNFVPGVKPVALKTALLQTATQNTNESCNSSTLSTAKAPLQNIFGALTADESASVTKFLHVQPELSLTANANATRCVTPLCRGRLAAPLCSVC